MSSPIEHKAHVRTHSQNSHSSSPPSQVFHPSSPLSPALPTPSLLESVAGAAHYSGVPVDSDVKKRHRRNSSNAMAVATLIPDHQRVLDDLRELYCCRPTKEIIDRLFRKDVEFEDPLAKCHGIGELAAQWYTMTKMFSKSETLSFRLMASTASPNQVVFWQQQAYTFRLLNKTKTIESVVTADLDEDGKITHLTDQWNGGELPTFFGSTLLRTVNAKIVPWLVHVPKD